MQQEHEQLKFLLQLLDKAVEAVQPQKRLDHLVIVDKQELHIGTIGNRRPYRLGNEGKCYIVGFGKAIIGMAKRLEEILGDHLCRGVISVPKGSNEAFRKDGKLDLLLHQDTKIQVFEGAENNIPDQDSFQAALSMIELIQSLSMKDILFVLVSGGGSALMPCPTWPITLEEKSTLIKSLSLAGATIEELNCIRKRISDLKGGKLSILAKDSSVISFILSDIIGDPLDLIASGPTVPNQDPTDLANAIIHKYRDKISIPNSVEEVLARKMTPISPVIYSNTQNILVGNNDLALEGARRFCLRNGVNVVRGSSRIDGEANKVAEVYAKLALSAAFDDVETVANNFANILTLDLLKRLDFINCLTLLRVRRESFCLINGGETVVHVQGNGQGGRNQELALSYARQFHSLTHHLENFPLEITLMSCGTDGIDGPTDAAGAVAYNELVRDAEMQLLDVDNFLANNNSYEFFSKLNFGQNLIKLGHTGTNVMDIHVMLFSAK